MYVTSQRTAACRAKALRVPRNFNLTDTMAQYRPFVIRHLFHSSSQQAHGVKNMFHQQRFIHRHQIGSCATMHADLYHSNRLLSLFLEALLGSVAIIIAAMPTGTKSEASKGL